jgi:transposase InsO family protein
MLKTALLDLAAEWPTYGYRRLTQMMKRLGWSVNGKRVRRWMDELGLTGVAPVRTTRTTDSRHVFPRYPNRVKDLRIQRPDQVWVADITYIRLHTSSSTSRCSWTSSHARFAAGTSAATSIRV